jgi:hypothetical protein
MFLNLKPSDMCILLVVYVIFFCKQMYGRPYYRNK